MKPDPAFATSPICVTDKDYDFSIDPEVITFVESDPFYGYESETIVAHLTKLNDIATLFTNDEKTHYYYILKIFPLSLKGDAKTWFKSLTTRKRHPSGAPVLPSNGALLVRHYYHATRIFY